MAQNDKSKPTVLVVEDVHENLDVLIEALQSHYTVRPAINGRIALKAANIPPYPHLVLLDIMMPDMCGYEVCRQLKANETTRDIPIIFITAKSDEADELEGLNLGAADYIAKPISIPIVQALVKTQLALQEAGRALESQNQRLLYERKLIESIILKMRGADTLDDRYLRYLVAPVEGAAGDMLLSTFTPEGRQLILLGDFTGHGLPAAIGSPLVTYILHTLAHREAPGSDVFREINSQLCARLPMGIFFAATLIEIHAERNSAFIWNASLPENLLIRDGIIQKRFPSCAPPLGVLKDLDMDTITTSVSLEKGDRLFAFSDGIIEAKSENGELFRMKKLEAFLVKALSEGLPLDDLMIVLEEHVNFLPHDDDITLVEIHV